MAQVAEEKGRLDVYEKALFILLQLGMALEQRGPRTTGITVLGGITFLLMTSSITLSTRAAFHDESFG